MITYWVELIHGYENSVDMFILPINVESIPFLVSSPRFPLCWEGREELERNLTFTHSILLFLLSWKDGQAEEESGDRRGWPPSHKERREACHPTTQGEKKKAWHRQNLHQYLHRPLHLQPYLVLLCPLHAFLAGQTGGNFAPLTACPRCQQHQRCGVPWEVLGLLPTPGLLWDENQEPKICCHRYKTVVFSTFTLKYLLILLTKVAVGNNCVCYVANGTNLLATCQRNTMEISCIIWG